MKKPLEAFDVFPLAFGNEEETGMQIGKAGELGEPYDLVAHLEDYFPDGLGRCGYFLSNGFKIYPGSNALKEMTNLERATPECGTPSEAVRYMRASENLLLEIAGSYAVKASIAGAEPVHVRLQRRVVDSERSRKGSHDNFGVQPSSDVLKGTGRLPAAVVEHLCTRSIRDGAGFVAKHKLHYAQKVGGLKYISKYGYLGSMYRISNRNGTPRIEIRCGDINISDWAVRMRVGCTALVLALCGTQLGRELKVPFRSDQAVINRANEMNALRLNPDGTIAHNQTLRHAADFQQRCAELVLGKLHRHVDRIPREYLDIADKSYRYMEDYKQVLAGQATIHLLANRADWAAKFAAILRDVERGNGDGQRRTLNDMGSRAKDLAYDYIALTAEDGAAGRILYGYGYKLRDRGILKGTIDAGDVLRASREAPASTRAGIRAALLGQYAVDACDWHFVRLQGQYGQHEVRLPFVRQTDLFPEDAAALGKQH